MDAIQLYCHCGLQCSHSFQISHLMGKWWALLLSCHVVWIVPDIWMTLIIAPIFRWNSYCFTFNPRKVNVSWVIFHFSFFVENVFNEVFDIQYLHKQCVDCGTFFCCWLESTLKYCSLIGLHVFCWKLACHFQTWRCWKTNSRLYLFLRSSLMNYC